MRRTDIHCHLLPGLDDGARDLEESLVMASDAVRDGTGTIVATPHVRADHVVDVSDLPDRVRQLREKLRESSIPLKLYCGGELGHDMVGRLSQGELEAIAPGPPHARWLLVESPWGCDREELHAATDELRDRGFGVVLAHPERCPELIADDFAGLRHELLAGALPQINVWSLAGRHGEGPEAAAAEMLRRGMGGVIASDSHPGWRLPQLSVGRRAALAHVDSGGARRLADTAPAQLLRRGLPERGMPLAA